MDSSLYFGGAIVLGAFVWFFCAYLCYVTAGQKHRRPVTWLILGIIFGPFALFAVFLMPKGNLKPAAKAGASASHGSSPSSTSDGGSTAHGSGAQHGATKTQEDLYEVPKKHKH